MTVITETSEERVQGEPAVSSTNANESLYQVADEILRQVVEDLPQNAVTLDSQLTHPSELIPGSTIGKHLR
jgi:hypothetical protein